MHYLVLIACSLADYGVEGNNACALWSATRPGAAGGQAATARIAATAAAATSANNRSQGPQKRRQTTLRSADAQKRYSEKLLGVQRKLFALADAWNIEMVLLVGGRTVESAFSSFHPGALTEWMLSNQVAASIAKSVADKPKQSGGGTSARSDKFTQGSCEMISVSRRQCSAWSISLCLCVCCLVDSLEAMPVAGIRTLVRQLIKNIALHKVRESCVTRLRVDASLFNLAVLIRPLDV
jgi:hypothetical protein